MYYVGQILVNKSPRLLCEYAQDERMTNAYIEGKDLYATIASSIYHNDYWDNMEHRQDGTYNPQGAERRTGIKSVLLGLLYGRGPASIAEQIGCSVQEAQGIINNFYKTFPKVKKWMDDTVAFAKQNGYVEDFWGRKRRLPDIQLPRFTVTDIKNSNSQFNPLLECKALVSNVINPNVEKYKQKMSNCTQVSQIKNLKAQAKAEGIEIVTNDGKISQAERQSINSRVQGGAATMTKRAMNNIYKSEELKQLGFRLLLQVHDEVIGECPKENVNEVCELLTTIMKSAAKPEVKIPFKCDAAVTNVWYEDTYGGQLEKETVKLMEKGVSLENAKQKVFSEHTELTPEQFEYLFTTYVNIDN